MSNNPGRGFLGLEKKKKKKKPTKPYVVVVSDTHKSPN